MSKEIKNNVPQIAITTYESNEDDIEVSSLFNKINEKTNNKDHRSRSVSPTPNSQKSKIILKSPIANSLQKSLSPGLIDLNNVTDVEIMSDSDDEKYYIRTPNLTPGPIDYFILTDIEDLSEDEGHEINYNIKNEHMDTKNFTYDTDNIFTKKNQIEQTETSFKSLSNFPEPHREILYHSKDGTISALTPTEESNPILLKSLNEEVGKGCGSEEEFIADEEYIENDPYFTNNNIYYHDIDVGVETVKEFVETTKQERCKPKFKNRTLVTNNVMMPEIDSSKRRIRNKNRSNSEIEESFERCLGETKKKSLSKYMSEQTLNKVFIPTHNQNNKIITNKRQNNNNKFILHDNRNGLSITIDFESHHSILLNIGREYGNLSMKWFNNGLKTGSILSPDYKDLETGYFIKSSLYDLKQQLEVDLFTYGTMKTFQNSYFTYIYVYPVIQPVNIVKLYINRLLQTQLPTIKKQLVKIYSLKDRFPIMEELIPSPITLLSAFEIFNRKEEEKYEVNKKIKFESKKHVSDIIHIFENMYNNPKLPQKIDLKKFSYSNYLNKKYNNLYTRKKNLIGKYK